MDDRIRTRIPFLVGGALLVGAMGWVLASVTDEATLKDQATALQASEPALRLQALQALPFDGSDEMAELVLRRITDNDEYVRGTAMERAYRLDLADRLDSRHLPTVLASAQEGDERSRRWALALLTAHSLELGLSESLRAWPGLRSPYSRPFLVAVLARTAGKSPDAERRIEALASRNATGAAMVEAIRKALALPPGDRYPCPFPDELRLDPERPATTHQTPSPAPVRPLPIR